MMTLSRSLRCLAFLLAGAEGARVARKGGGAVGTKFIAGVPVLNYEAAYDGAGVLGELETEREEEWIVVVSQETSEGKLKRMCQSASNGCNLVGSPSKGGAPFLEMRGTEKDLEALIITAHGAVRYAEPDQKIYLIPEIQTDEEVGSAAATWGLNKVGKDSAAGAGAGTTVFVLDTGVRVTHREFGGRALPSLDMTVGEPEYCQGDLTCAGDVQGHGTHCAGSAGGATFGVAPATAIRSIKVLGDDGSGSLSWSYFGLNYLATSSVRPAVASMSLGAQGTHSSMKHSVDAAVSAGVVVVVAAGNSNANACIFSPAYVPSAITVGSMDSNDDRSYFSNYGKCTDIWAPGSSIKSASYESDTGSSTLSGTSMACPHVSGGAALVLEANPTYKSEDVIDHLSDTAIKNLIADLKSGDKNLLLWVGAGAAPIAPPTPAPPPTPPPPKCPRWTADPEPDEHGDCACKPGLFCSLNGVNRNCPTSVGPGGWGGEYFLPTCTACRCYFDWGGGYQ